MDAGYTYFPIILTNLNRPWEKVAEFGTPVSFKVKYTVTWQGHGEAASGLYFIKRGRIKLSNIAVNGQEKVLFYMGAGTLFNETPMLTDTFDYIFTCVEDVEAVFIPKRRVVTIDFIREYPELLLNLLESISYKLRIFYSQLCSLRAYDSFVNVCRVLVSMHLFNRRGAGVEPQLTQQELAAFLSIHRSSLHKALLRLKEEGIIGSYTKKSIEIYDIERLRYYAEHGDSQ